MADVYEWEYVSSFILGIIMKYLYFDLVGEIRIITETGNRVFSNRLVQTKPISLGRPCFIAEKLQSCPRIRYRRKSHTA